LSTCTDEDLAVQCLIAGGDDYELVFTARPEKREVLRDAGLTAGVPVTRIGRIVEGGPLPVLLDAARKPVPVKRYGFDHFTK